MNQKRMAYSTLVYFILSFLPLASSFLLTPIYAQYLKPSQYGVLAIANLFQGYLSLLVSFGIDTAFTRFYFNAHKDKNKIKTLLSTALISILLISFFIGIVLFFAGDQVLLLLFDIPGYTWHNFGFPVLITSAFSTCYVLLCAYYRDTEQIKSFSILAVIYFLFITVGSLIGVVYLNKGVEGSIYGKLGGTIATMIIFLPVSFFNSGIKVQFELTKKMLIYGFPILIYGVLGLLFDSMDRLIINHFYTLKDLGIYNFAFVIASIINVMISSYQSAVNPSIYKMMLHPEVGSEKKLNTLMKRFIWVGLLFSSLCMALSYPFLKFLINESYYSSLLFIPVLSLSFVMRAHYIIFSYPLFIHNKTKVLPIINVISIVSGVILNFILIPVFGIFGIAISVFFIKLIQAISAYFFINKLNLNPKEIYHMPEINIVVKIFSTYVLLYTCLISFFPIQTIFLFLPFPILAFLYLKYDNTILQKIINLVRSNGF